MTHDRYGRLFPMTSMTWPTKMHEFVEGVPMTYQRPYLNVVVELLLHRHGGQLRIGPNGLQRLGWSELTGPPRSEVMTANLADES